MSGDTPNGVSAPWTSPAPQTLSPASAVSQVASLTSLPASSLGTVEIPFTSTTLYHAALEYAALYPRDAADAQRPLWQNPEDAMHPLSESESEGEESDGGIDYESMPRGTSRSALRRRRVPVPKFHFGLGDCKVSWPPPEGMPVAVREEDAVLEAGMLLNSDSATTANGGEAKVEEEQEEEKEEEKEEAKEEEKEKEEKEETWAGDVYFVHTAVGDPISIEHEGAAVYRTLLLISPGGEEGLRAFCKGVVKWRADKDHRPARAGRFALYRFKTDCNRGYWQLEGMKKARPTSSVVLPKGMLEDIFDDIRLFLARDTRRWYVKHGLPHRRALIFSGPPGTGKTSCIRALASTFRLNLCFLSATSKTFGDQLLGDALGGMMPRNALLVIEDVDSLFNEDRKNSEGGLLTFSAFLNALDGFLSAEGVVTVMTTNHVDKIDAALMRGGRVDRRFEFARPIQTQISDLFTSFYPDSEKSLADQFASDVFSRPEGDEARSIATLQQLFIAQRRSSAEECVKAVQAFFDQQFPNGANNKNPLYM